MRSVKCSLDENEFRSITDEAKKLGVHRSELIRTKITSAPVATPAPSAGTPTASQSLDTYLDVVAALRKRMGNSITRAQAEQATAIVLQCLYS